MATTSTDRRYGVSSGLAFKAPCKAATTANITLSGEQTIDGVALVTGDRCLVKNQTTASENGIYVVDTSSWELDRDWDGARDVKKGTSVRVTDGTTNIGFWYVTTSDPITPGTTSVSFSRTTNLADSSVLSVATIAALKALDISVLAENDTVTVIEEGRSGDFRWVTGDQSANVTADTQSGIWVAPDSAPTGASGAWKRVSNGIVDVRAFGAIDTAGTDSTAAFQGSADVLGYIAIPLTTTPFEIDSITTTRATTIFPIHGEAFVKLRTPAITNKSAITLANANSHIVRGIRFDGNSTRRSIATVTATRCSAFVDAENVNYVNGDAQTISALVIEGSYCEYGVFGKTFTGDAAGNDSVPRLVSIHSGGTDSHGHYAIGHAIQCGITTQASGGVLDSLHIVGALDNGIYCGGGNFTCESVHYDGSEEALVNVAGDLHVGTLTLAGASVSSGISLSNSGDTTVGLIDVSATKVGNIAKLRTDNTASGRCIIGAIVGQTLMDDVPFSLSTGTIDFLSIRNNDLEAEYQVAVSGTISQWANFSSCKQFEFIDWSMVCKWGDGVATSADNFAFTLPSTNLTYDSEWRNARVFTVDNTGAASAATARWTPAAQNLISVDGAVWVANVGPYLDTSVSDIPNSTNTTPTGGTWKAGTELMLRAATASPFRIRCTVAGTPGTWVQVDILYSVSADKGDAAATLTYLSSNTTNIWNTPITADRAVTLSTTGAVNGAKFRIVRTAAATGAFNLNVGTGPLKALATAGTWCDVEYNGSAWVLTAYGTL